jgi:type I restriction enzyme S subunit
MSKIPKLRFKEFSEEWEEKKLKSILLDFRLGGNYSNSETVNHNPLIKMGNLNRGNIVLNKIEYIAENEDIYEIDRIKYGDLFFNTRNTLDLVGKVAIWRNELPKAYYNSNLMWMKYENNFFMNYRFNSFQGIKSLRRIATGTTSVAAIYTKDLLKISLNIPQKEEQERIASFLTSVDSKIEQLTRKEELLQQYKKGVMQKIFNQEIRFSPKGTSSQAQGEADDGSEFCEWKKEKLSKYLVEYKVKSTYENEYPVLTSSNKGLMLQSDYFGENRLTERDNKGFNIVPSDFITYRSRSDNRTFTFNINTLGFKGIISTYYPVFECKNADNRFIITLLNENKHFVGKYSVGTSQTVLSFNELKNIRMFIPSVEEQNKIANFLSSLDTKIEQTGKQLEQTKEFKKALLQQMFV